MKQTISLSKKFKQGFTIVEVTLFLALSSVLMLGVIIATNASVSRQRYNDSVNDFADFLRGIYSQVMDVEHGQEGKSGEAVYGKFITFRERGNSTNTIYVYSVIGKVINSADIADLGTTDTLGVLKNINTELKDHTEHVIPWEANLETSTGNDFVGAVLIVRSPVSGTVRTFTSTQEYNPSDNGSFSSAFLKYINDGRLGTSNLDFCVDSDDNNYGNRRDIRLLGGGVNSTAVNMVAMDDGESECQGR